MVSKLCSVTKLRGLEEFVINCSGMMLSCRALPSYTVGIISAAEFELEMQPVYSAFGPPFLMVARPVGANIAENFGFVLKMSRGNLTPGQSPACVGALTRLTKSAVCGADLESTGSQ